MRSPTILLTCSLALGLLALGCDDGKDDTTPEGYSDTAVDADADTDTGDRGGCPCLGTT